MKATDLAPDQTTCQSAAMHRDGASKLPESREVDIPFNEEQETGVAFSCLPGYVAFIEMPQDLQSRRLLERAARLIAEDGYDQLYTVLDQLAAIGWDLIGCAWLRLSSMKTPASEGDYIYTVDLAARRMRFHSMFCLVRCGLMRGHKYSIEMICEWREWATQLMPGCPMQRVASECLNRSITIESYDQAIMAHNEWGRVLSLDDVREQEMRQRASAFMVAHDEKVVREASRKPSPSDEGSTTPRSPRRVRL